MSCLADRGGGGGLLRDVAVQRRAVPPEGRRPRWGSASSRRIWPGRSICMADEERRAAPGGAWPGSRRRARPSTRARSRGESSPTTRRHGGYLTAADLASFRTRARSPVRIRWRDFELFTCGPWCQGPVLAEALCRSSTWGSSAARIDDPAYAHLLIEVLKAAFADREYRYGDPNFVDVGVDELMSMSTLEARAAGIDRRARPPRAARSDRSGSLPVDLLPSPEPAASVGGRATRRTCASSTARATSSRLLPPTRPQNHRDPRYRFRAVGRAGTSRAPTRAPLRRRPGRAAEIDAEPGTGRARRRLGLRVRMPRRRHAGAGDVAGVRERLPLRSGRPGGHRRSSRVHVELSELVRPSRIPSQPRCGGGSLSEIASSRPDGQRPFRGALA